MNRKHICWLLVSTFVLIVVIISYKLSQKLEEKEKLEAIIQNLMLQKMEMVGESGLQKSSSKLIALFHPSCDFCQAEATQFRKFYQELSSIDALWISYDIKDSIENFSKTFGLDTLPNMHFAYMDIEAMLERYGNVKFPTFLAYDEDGRLIKKFVGLTKPEEILSAYQTSKD